MKKFTGNFLFGEHGFGYVLRKIGLSMVAILLTVAVYAQPQETYHVFAEDVEDCYRHDNEYLVSISMRDFVEIDSFFLVLNYDDALFNYEGVSATVSELSGLSITDNSGDLEMVWDSGDDPQTIEDTDNDTSEVFVLHFSRNGYLHNAGNPALNHVNSALEWDEAASSVWSDAAQQSQILTFAYGDGSIDVTQTIPEVVLDKSTANCDGGNALVTVTTPAYEDGMTYSWNQDDDFQSDPSTQVVAPSQGNTVEVRLGDCTSFIHTFSVDANPPLSYDVQEDIYVKCAGGLGDLEFDPEGGSGSYSYYIVPEADTARVINDLTNTGKTNEQAVDYLDSEGYNTGNRVNQLSPGFYLVAVQDGNNCADLREVEWWTGVEVMDTIPEWDHAVTHILDEQCYDANNGEFTLMVSGGTPFDGGGYNIMFDGHEESTVTNTLEKTELAPGAYDVAFYDQHGCSWDTTITIEAAEQIDFAVDHTDASCDLDNGELWIEEATLEGGSGSYDYWVYSMDPNFATADTIWSVSDTATGLAPNVYYVRVFDDLGCFDDYENINGDNAVKVLSIDFDIEVGTIECNGGTTSATIVVENPGNHTFGFNIDGGAFSSENVFEGLTAGTYSFGVYDSTINCVNYWKKEIEERTELTVDIIDLLTTEPSCHDANDGHIQVRADGGTPFDDGTKFYEYKFDDRPWEDGGESNTFAADTGFHMITVRDANGCEATVTTTLDLTPNVIEVPETFALDCYGDVTVLWQEAMYADSSSIVKSWIQEPVGDNQGDREPEIYYCMSISDDAAAIVANGMAYTDTSTFAAGTYYFAAQDEWGCVSNIDTLVVTQPDAIVAEAEVVRPAGCAGVNDGQIMIEAFLGIDRGGSFEGRYQYSFTQSAAIMQQDDWYDEVDWHDFTNDDAANDSVVALDVAKGTYWIAVRDSCGKKNPVLIEGPWELVVDGAEPIEVNWDLVDVMDVTCNVAGEDPSNDGSITGLLGATTGGWGDYIFTLDMEHHDASVLKAGHLDFPRENMTGDFYDLPAGDYVLTIEDDSLGCIYTDDVEITQPNPLWLDTDSLYVSCDGETDGVIRYTISGGTPPYLETTNNVGVYEDVNSIPEDRWYAVDSVEYDRRMPAGVFATYIKDDNGCIYGPVIDTIKQPEPLALELVGTIEPSCATDGVDGDDDDGQIWVVPTGGWHSDMDNYMYEVSLGGTSYTVDLGDTVKFTGLSASEYTISVVERNSSLPANPIITYSDYFTKWGNGDYDSHLPWQNASSDCAADIDVNLQGPDPIVYDDIMWYDEQCYKTPTGEIHLMDISGGTPPYTVWVEGPTAYRPDNAGVGEEILLEDDGVNLDDYIWDDLVRGNYTVYVQDANECQIVEESGEIGRPDSLMITNTELVENAKCKDGLGTIQIDAEGGVAPYWYAVDYSLVPDQGTHPIPPEIDDRVEWQMADTFQVEARTWVAWVKDANGCIVGYASDEEGDPILQHRVTVLEPDSVMASGFDMDSTLCYGSVDGKIFIGSIWGGNGGDWDVEVTGTDWEGNDVSKWYSDVSASNAVLDSLPASTVKDPMVDDLTAEDYYTVVVYDSEGCVSAEYHQYVLQPEPFEVELKTKNDAFVCANDLAGVFEMVVVRGGTPFGYNGNDPVFEFRWESYTDESMEEIIDSVSWGFTKTFQGPAGRFYVAHARDANGCETSTDTFIVAPEPIEFDVHKLTCFGDELASARVTAMGTEGRSFRVWYREIEEDVAPGDWEQSDWFTDHIDLMNEFTFDDDDVTDFRYAFMVEDTLGCVSEADTLAFDPVQMPLEIEVETIEVGECTSDVDVVVRGGTPPYVITVNDSVVEAGMHTLPAGTYDFVVTDDHLVCTDNVTIDVVADPVVRDTTIEAFIGYDAEFVDEVAGVDTTLAADDEPYAFEYVAENGCTRHLHVTVVAVPRPVDIITVQSEADESAWIGDTVEVTGTVTAVQEGEGFYMQDAVAAWSGIWVAHSETADVAVGDGVTIVGEVAEVANVTTILASELMEATGTPEITPIPAGPEHVAMEAHESLLITLEGVRADTLNTESGEWVVYTDTEATVNDWLYAYTDVVEGDYYDVTGVVNGRLDIFKLDPRMESDVVNISETTDINDLRTVEFKIYPNPFENELNIDTNGKLSRVVISNIAGQKVMDVENPGTVIRTANLVSGVYVISLFTEDGIAQSKRIVKR